MMFRTRDSREVLNSPEGLSLLRIRPETRVIYCRIFTVACALLSIFSVAHPATAAVCETVGGTLFSTSEAVANTFSLALQRCGVFKSKNTEQALQWQIDANLHSNENIPGGGGPEAQQLNLYDAVDNNSLVLERSFPITGPQPVPLTVPVQNNPATSAEHINPGAKAIMLNMYAVAKDYNIDPLLLHAIAYVESRHNPHAVSPIGAVGLMQVMPTTARRFGVDNPEFALRDPLVNLRVSSAYLKTLQGLFGNDLPLVLAAYNAGEHAVIKYGRQIPPYRETQAYVRDVMDLYLKLKGLR